MHGIYFPIKVGDTAKDIAIQLGNKEFSDVIPTPMVCHLVYDAV